MAETTVPRRAYKRPSAAGIEEAAASSSNASGKLRFLAFVVLLGIAGGAIALAVWQPSLLTEWLAPVWEYGGLWLVVAPTLLLALYVAFRIFGLANLWIWRCALAALMGAGTAQTTLLLLDVTEIQGIPVENELSRYLGGFSDLMLIGLMAGLMIIAIALVLPYGVLTGMLSDSKRAKPRFAGAGIDPFDELTRGADAGLDSADEPLDEAPVREPDPIRLDDPPVPRTRIFVPEPTRGAARPTYPEPVGVVRDQQRRLEQERQATKEAAGQRPRIIMPGVPADADVDNATRALRQRYVGAAAATTEVLDRPAETETVGDYGHDSTTAVEERPIFPVPPPGLSTSEDYPAHFPANTDMHGEGAGIDSDELDEMLMRDPLAIIDDGAEDDDFSVDAEEFEQPEDEFETHASDTIFSATPTWDSTVDEPADVEESASEDEDDEPVDPALPRSDSALLNSLDPFAGLPKVSWKFPSFKLFDEQPPTEVDTESHLETAEAIQETLQEYGIEVEVTEVRPGPTVTLYGVRPGWDRRYRSVRERNEDGEFVTKRQEVGRTRVKVDAIAKLDDDLALQLKAASVRIEPIPGTNLVGVEVPNLTPETVYMRPQLESEPYLKARGKSKLAFPLGKGSGGEAVVADLARMPHLLVAGSTGSGKSVFVNSLITSLITHATPEDLRFVMIDPKRVELTIYNGIPHLITPVIVDTQRVVNALQWSVQQMEDRLELLAQEGARDITSYNERAGEGKRMPYLVVIVDELADLMMTSGKTVETGLVRLAQMGRATGIHLVVATQRPSVNVITGLIKANFPTRVSFMVTSLVDSRTILDGAGAEKLLGRGDMLYLPQDAARPVRIQSAFISSHESDAVVDAWRAQSRGYVPPELPELVQPEDIGLQSRGRNGTDGAGEMNGTRRNGSGGDDIMEQARELADIYKGKVSTSLLQRRLGIGYPRAARLRDRLVEEGLAGAEIPNAPAETAGRGIRRTRSDASDELDDA